MDQIFKENIDELDTSQSYFRDVYFNSKTIMIPYFNVGLSCHELNKSDRLMFISKSFLVFSNVMYLKINSSKILIDKPTSNSSIYLGGLNLNTASNIVELEIKSEEGFLQILEDSILSEDHWIPVDTPNYPSNMDKEEVENFIKFENFPSNLIKLFITSSRLNKI